MTMQLSQNGRRALYAVIIAILSMVAYHASKFLGIDASGEQVDAGVGGAGELISAEPAPSEKAVDTDTDAVAE